MASSQLYRRALPASARITHWAAPDGWRLRRFDWPAAGNGKGNILFQGGRGDIPEKYLELFAHWHGRGWSITSFDWRGQGGSGRLTADATTGHIDDFAIYIDDLVSFFAEWEAEVKGPKIFIGHSMGAHLLLRATSEGALPPDALVLVAPMLGLHSPMGAMFGEWAARLLGGVGDSSRPAWKTNEKPGTKVSRQALLTHDLGRYADEAWWQSAKPELSTGPPSWRWVIEAFRSTREQRANPALAQLKLPILMVLPMADQLVDAKAALKVGAKLPDVRIVKFGDEAAHEVLRELDPVRNRAIAEIDIFLAARVLKA